MRRNSIVTAALALVALFAVAGCSGQPLSTREKGTLGGAGIGAATGAIIGAAVGLRERVQRSAARSAA